MVNYRNDLILIASADNRWGIGYQNSLLKRIPEDMKRFAELTRGNMIITGRKTLESFKDSKPLAGRINVVLTRNMDFQCEGATIFHDLHNLMYSIRSFPGKVYVSGGESVYRLFLPYCSTALITRICGEFTADTHLPDLDAAAEWMIKAEGDWQESKNGMRFKYVRYIRRNQRP